MTEDEAIEILKVAERTKCNGDTYTTSELNAIETILDELKKYDAGEIISIKVLEKYYLVSKDKEKQMINANKELFKEYIPKDKIRELLENTNIQKLQIP